MSTTKLRELRATYNTKQYSQVSRHTPTLNNSEFSWSICMYVSDVVANYVNTHRGIYLKISQIN